MSLYQQGAAFWPISGVPLEQWKQIHALGITGVEMPPREKFDELRELGFTISTIGGHKTLEDGLNKRSNHSRIADELRANLELAQKYQIPNLIVFSGNRNGISDAEGLDICAEGLNLVKADAERAGVTLIMELLNSKVDHPDYQCDHTAWGAQLVQMVGSPRVKLLYDIYHMQIMEGDIIRTIRQNIEHIAHFHTAGNPGRKDLDDQQELYYPAIARAIGELGYSGWIGHEYGPKGDALASLQQAFDAFDV